jgi:hypothetical protein
LVAAVQEGDEGDDTPGLLRDDPRRILLLWGWTLLVVLYFAWEVVAYRGLFAVLAEWQFVHLGQDLPSFTFGALIFIFSWPVLLLVGRHSHQRRPTEDISPAASEREDLLAAVQSARDYMHFLFGFAVSLTFATIVALCWTMLLPTSEAPPRQVNVVAGDPGEGPAIMQGTVHYGRLASFSRGILFFRRTSIYAPVMSGTGLDQPVRYFVEFLPGERADITNGGSITHRRGILVRNDLPGALRRLYDYLGYRTAPHYYILYASPLTIRWPYYLVAIQFALGAVVFVVVALLQRRRVRALGAMLRRRTLRDGVEAPASS